jgi:hypothetical protein
VVEAEAGGGFVKINLGTAELIGCPGVPETESLELGRDVSKMLSIEVIEIRRVLGTEFGYAPREIKMGSVASGGSCKFAIEGPLPG